MKIIKKNPFLNLFPPLSCLTVISLSVYFLSKWSFGKLSCVGHCRQMQNTLVMFFFLMKLSIYYSSLASALSVSPLYVRKFPLSYVAVFYFPSPLEKIPLALPEVLYTTVRERFREGAKGISTVGCGHSKITRQFGGERKSCRLSHSFFPSFLPSFLPAFFPGSR